MPALERHSLQLRIEEAFLCSKKGAHDGGEDRLVRGVRYVGTVDGATDKSGKNWGTATDPRTGGQTLAQIVSQLLVETRHATLSPNSAEFQRAVLTKLSAEARRAGIDLTNPINRPFACFSILDAKERIVYYTDSANFGFLNENGKFISRHYTRQLCEIKNSLMRAVAARRLEQEGKPVVEMVQGKYKDWAREAILEPLRKTLLLVNADPNSTAVWTPGCSVGDFRLFVFNGFPNPYESVVRTMRVPAGTKQVILASDGFPSLEPTLAESLEHLDALLKADPLCINELLGTKALAPGNRSFDDLAYLRVILLAR